MVAEVSCLNLNEDGKCKLREGRYFSEECIWNDPGSYIVLINIYDHNKVFDEKTQKEAVAQETVHPKAPETLIVKGLRFLGFRK